MTSLKQPSTSDILASKIKDFLVNSKCATNMEERLFLNKLFGNKRLLTILLFCGSINGW